MLKKISILLALVALLAYLIASMTIFNRPATDSVCQRVELKINKAQNDDNFITAQEVEQLLQRAKLYAKGKRMVDIQCQPIEDYLQKNPLIARVECYVTPTNTVCIEVTQRCPILRIMADNGEQYYLDSEGEIMPLGNYAAHVAVVTGSVTKKNVRDIAYELGQYLDTHPFWRSQIEQIHVTPKEELELVPRVGNHVVYFGKPRDISEKLSKLKAFYADALNTVGWNKYSRISVEFTNQIICTKKEK